MTSSSYIRWCTVCQKGFSSDFEWLNHLLLKSHQDEVSSESGTWEEETLECCVVVFTADYPKRIPNRAVLKYFSDLGCGLVTDFVCSLEKRNAVLVQFESRDKVDKLFALTGIKCSEAIVDNQLIQLRRFMDYMTLERDCLFPGIGKPPQPLPKNLSSPTSECHQESSSIPCTSHSHVDLSTLKSQLTRDFSDIRNEVEIPRDTFTTVLKLMEKLQKILSRHYNGCKLFLFRHWYLQLHSMGTNQLLMFVKHDDFMTKSIFQKDYWQLFQQADSLLILPHLKCLKDKDNSTSKVGLQMEPYGSSFKDLDSGIPFTLVNYGYLSPEMQTCQLLKHLVTTSPHFQEIRAFMMIIFYWGRINNISLQRPALRVTHRCQTFLEPVPSAVSWLLVFFLSHRKMVPSVKQVVKAASIDAHFGSRVTDPGFPMESDFVESPFLEKEIPGDKTDFVISVVKLAEQFFSFFGDHLQNEMTSPVILNTRDGQIIKAEQGKDAEGKQVSFHFKGTGGKLGVEEKRVLSEDSFLNAFENEIKQQKAMHAKVPVYILHPLHFANRFPLGAALVAQAWSAMSKTAKRLSQLLKTLEDKGEEKEGLNKQEISLKAALKLGEKGCSEEPGTKRKRNSIED